MGVPSGNRGKIDTSREIARIVDRISRYGPNIQRIADETGIWTETVRYRYKRFLLGRGFTVRAVPNYEKLGVKRLLAIVAFSDLLEADTDAFLSAMHESCYLRSSQKVIFSPDYILHMDCPAELIERCKDVLMRLKQLGVLTKVEVIEFDRVRVPPMNAKMYDFLEEFWSFQWSSTAEKQALPSRVLSHRVAYDYIDLLILKELAIDATKPLTTIATKLDVKYRTLGWHYRQHVMGSELIRSFDVAWNGAKIQEGAEEKPSATSRQRAIPVSFLLRDATEAEKLKMMLFIDSLPFLAFEAVGPRDYFATLRFPPHEHTEALEHISSFVQSFARKCTSFTIDELRSIEFPMPYRSYNRDSKLWQLDEESILTKFENALLRVRIGGKP